MDDMTLGSLIAKLRKERNMTQADLAAVMGVTDKAVSKWERDLSYPDIASFPRLAQTLGVTVDELMRSSDMKGKASGEKDRGEIIQLALKAVALAMGIAVTVLSILGEIDGDDAVTMLGAGMACLAVNALSDKASR